MKGVFMLAWSLDEDYFYVIYSRLYAESFHPNKLTKAAAVTLFVYVTFSQIYLFRTGNKDGLEVLMNFVRIKMQKGRVFENQQGGILKQTLCSLWDVLEYNTHCFFMSTVIIPKFCLNNIPHCCNFVANLLRQM